FDFPQRGNMPPVKVFWHDAQKETPKFDNVPAGELLGDLPSRPRQRPQGQAAAQTRPTPPPFTGFVGRVFDWEKFQSDSLAPDARLSGPNGSVFFGDKGILTTGTYGEQ